MDLKAVTCACATSATDARIPGGTVAPSPSEERMPVLRIVTEIQAPPETCFDPSRSIDLHLESMIVAQERAVAGVTSGLIGSGEEVTWEARTSGGSGG